MSRKVIARSRSADQAQQHLRDRKAKWNEECSKFIARLNAFKPHLIAFKRGLNGRGDAKAGLPISDIKNPLPSEISSYLNGVGSEFNDLASTFASLVNEANGIVNEQSEYSSSRRKPMTQSALLVGDELIVEASNPLSRFWAQVSSKLSSDEITVQRLSMLKMALGLFEKLVEFEDVVLEKNVDNIPKILNFYLLLVNQVKTLNLAIKNMLDSINKNNKKIDVPDNQNTITPATQVVPKNKSQTPIKPLPVVNEKPEENIQEENVPEPKEEKISNISIEKLKDEVVFMTNLGFTIDDIRPFLDLYHNKYKNEKSPEKKTLIADRMRQVYQELFLKLKSKVESKIKKRLPPGIDLKSILELEKESNLSEGELEKFAGNYLSRLYKRFKHWINQDVSTSARLKVFHDIRELKIEVDKIMDLLENKNFDPKAIEEQMSKVYELMIQMKNSIELLNALYSSNYYENSGNKKIMDPASRYFAKQFRKDIDKSGW